MNKLSKLSIRLEFKVSAEDRKFLQAQAKKQKVSVGEYLRSLIKKKLHE